ncbi:efflux RND transporter periplasmic adaptor subunit [uncultured Alistipes sp.]|uniref:efflux RND transporter periplasmic adaptor subunit n=1 Tax=uncultured Alistipes sp. TaxID=538949 RepID=UPI0025A93B28|nr:efflux RND transporter periplasmic adaptor subunit [uncultured Alistipes sp.]
MMNQQKEIRPEKLLLQTYAGYARRAGGGLARWFRGISPRLKRWVAVAVCVVVLGVFAVVYVLRHRPVAEMLPVVAVEPVVTQDVNVYGEYVGRIRAQQFVEIRARVEGYLERMLFAEGTYINKGQTLFIIDPQLYRARANRARAQLNKARAQALKAQRDLNRIRPLYEQNAASQLDLDNAVAAYESAAADVVVCEADLTQAELTLGYTTVRSPVSGYISERNADIGALVGPGGQSLLATVVKSDTVRIDFSMTSLEYLRSKARNVNLGHRDSTRTWDPYITVTLADGSAYPLRGLVDFADPQIDPKTGTFSVRAEMPNPDHVLLPGQFTRVKLLMDVRENAVVVPAKALVIENGGAYIYVVRPDSVVEKRFVETGPEVGNNTVIERGLVPGEWIVVEGFHKLSHGMKVEALPAEPAKVDVVTEEE